MNSIYAIFGGSFDPIHYGHLNIINKIIKEIKLKEIIILPNYKPIYRNKSITNIIHRIKMIKYAISNQIQYKINLIEVKKKLFLL
ncbi:adenylyltransferase/cytidyltransferase family protein [Buchnera aphidicola]|uniref:adenylyltransferase/cytidyltransferase family protein n=1 Tax=Buchnera aphidicola TaxID=9 RepID=UPI003464D7D3